MRRVAIFDFGGKYTGAAQSGQDIKSCHFDHEQREFWH